MGNRTLPCDPQVERAGPYKMPERREAQDDASAGSATMPATIRIESRVSQSIRLRWLAGVIAVPVLGLGGWIAHSRHLGHDGPRPAKPALPLSERRGVVVRSPRRSLFRETRSQRQKRHPSNRRVAQSPRRLSSHRTQGRDVSPSGPTATARSDAPRASRKRELAPEEFTYLGQ
jgi:hypothetical protein